MNMYGRAIGIYLTLDAAGAKYEMKPQAEMPAGCAMAPPAVDIDGTCIGQTPAILTVSCGEPDVKQPHVGREFPFGRMLNCRHIPRFPGCQVLGTKFDLAGTTPEEKMLVLQSVEDMNDIFGEHGKMVDDAALKDKRFSYLEKKIAGKKWLAGTAEPTIADFHGVFAFEWVVKKGVDFSAYPNVTKWLADIRAHPCVAKMIASCVDGRSMIP